MTVREVSILSLCGLDWFTYHLCLENVRYIQRVLSAFSKILEKIQSNPVNSVVNFPNFFMRLCENELNMVRDLRFLCDKTDYAIIRYTINRVRL